MVKIRWIPDQVGDDKCSNGFLNRYPMIPSIINLKINSGRKFRLRLWLPIFILWPVFLVLFLIALPFLVIADIVLRVSGARIRLFGMIGGVLSVLSSLRGTAIKVRNPAQQRAVDVAVH